MNDWKVKSSCGVSSPDLTYAAFTAGIIHAVQVDYKMHDVCQFDQIVLVRSVKCPEYYDLAPMMKARWIDHSK